MMSVMDAEEPFCPDFDYITEVEDLGSDLQLLGG